MATEVEPAGDGQAAKPSRSSWRPRLALVAGVVVGVLAIGLLLRADAREGEVVYRGGHGAAFLTAPTERLVSLSTGVAVPPNQVATPTPTALDCKLPFSGGSGGFGLAFVPQFCAAWEPARWPGATGYRLVVTLDSQTIPGSRVQFTYQVAAGVSEFVFPPEAQLVYRGDACFKQDIYTVELHALMPSGEVPAGAQAGSRHCDP